MKIVKFDYAAKENFEVKITVLPFVCRFSTGCYHETFHNKIKRKSMKLLMDLLNNMKVIVTFQALSYVDCIPFLY